MIWRSFKVGDQVKCNPIPGGGKALRTKVLSRSIKWFKPVQMINIILKIIAQEKGFV
jgi:hypothetical protein